MNALSNKYPVILSMPDLIGLNRLLKPWVLSGPIASQSETNPLGVFCGHTGSNVASSYLLIVITAAT
jgi:hypothetical protein